VLQMGGKNYTKRSKTLRSHKGGGESKGAGGEISNKDPRPKKERDGEEITSFTFPKQAQGNDRKLSPDARRGEGSWVKQF